MVATINITVAYAQALLAATPRSMLVGEVKPKKLSGVTRDQMAIMKREMGNLQGEFESIEQTYGQDVLNLVRAKGYLVKLLENEAVIHFINSESARRSGRLYPHHSDQPRWTSR